LIFSQSPSLTMYGGQIYVRLFCSFMDTQPGCTKSNLNLFVTQMY